MFKVKINSLSLQTQKLLRQKQLEIEDFCVYWDTESEMLGKLPANQIQVCAVVTLNDKELITGILSCGLKTVFQSLTIPLPLNN